MLWKKCITGSFGVQCDCHAGIVPEGFLIVFGSRPYVVDGTEVVLVASVREVQAGNVHANTYTRCSKGVSISF